ncbi:multidrug resistance-associated abc transporter [Phaffia rhodozyma]|uniref:Multidrug resistance-associated abc transporter n=1 Tax=Phaffia rhodozyma TaxID=264483 RepID=A0A0F7SSN3_PHARH|nr:multidrug resistance-associated abc transporter [Phaffia rhodozyma]
MSTGSKPDLASQELIHLVFPPVLLFSLLLSLGLQITHRPKERQISLPLYTSPSSEQEEQQEGTHPDELEKDPFNFDDPDVFIDGTPSDGGIAFWKAMLIVKPVLLVLLLALVSVKLSSILGLGRLFGGDVGSISLSLANSVALVAYVYLAGLCVRYIRTQDIEQHWADTKHLASLLAIGTTGQALELLLPQTRKAHAEHKINLLDRIELGILFAALIVSIFIPRGPSLYMPYTKIYDSKTIQTISSTTDSLDKYRPNVSSEASSSIVSALLFDYAKRVVVLGGRPKAIEVGDLPIVKASMRALPMYTTMRAVYKDLVGQRKQKELENKRKNIRTKRGKGGWLLLKMILRANKVAFITLTILALITSILYYGPAFFLNRLLIYLQEDPERKDPTWGWIYCLGLFGVSAGNYILIGILWSVANTLVTTRTKLMLNTMLFQKTLVRKDIAGGGAAGAGPTSTETEESKKGGKGQTDEDDKDEEEDVTSKSQVQTLMTVDVDRCADFGIEVFSLIDSPAEIIVGGWFIYNLMGASALYGLAATLLFLPINHYASKFILLSEENAMKARDERSGLMNEILAGIRMIKFMAWERSFEERISKVRNKELFWQRRNYHIEVFLNGIVTFTPVAVTIIALFHYVYIREQPFSPSIAFTSVAIFRELQFALGSLPETVLTVIKSFVSFRRVEKYLALEEIELVAPSTSQRIYMNSLTVTWPRDRVALSYASSSSADGPSVPATPKNSFILELPSIECPVNELTLVCGPLGSGKTLLLKALLGEADILTGSLACPRSAPDAMSNFSNDVSSENWIQKSITAYVPQVAWLQNDSIRKNILFNLPMNGARYHATLEACALLSDLEILEDGDLTEIGESGLNLSGGQKARVSLARAVYSRASTVLLDDVLSAVDAHTARHLYEKCLQGPLMAGVRTVILVSHHVQLCAPGAKYVIALKNGAVEYAGDPQGFSDSSTSFDLLIHDPASKGDEDTILSIEKESIESLDSKKERSDKKAEQVVLDGSDLSKVIQKTPKKLVEDEKRVVGRINKSTWLYYFRSNGGVIYWTFFVFSSLCAMLVPYFENFWLQIWSSDYKHPHHSALFYVGIYAAISLSGIVASCLRSYIIFYGSLSASDKIHRKMLERVLFSTIRFHDTVSKGMLLNRFGKDLEGMDTQLSFAWMNTSTYFLSILIIFGSIAKVGGWSFTFSALALGVLYYFFGSSYGPTSRDLRRLDSVTRSPLYSLYAETVNGVSVLRAFGASTQTLRKMFSFADTNIVSYYWMWTLNRWVTARYNILSSAILGMTGVVVLLTPSISAPTAGFALSFALKVASDMLAVVRRYVGLEQNMIAVERLKEYSELPQEARELIEPRPEASWPSSGKISVQDLVIKYAPNLPNVLHSVSFEVDTESKVGIVGPTGCGKSTLALSFFRFVEATSGKIMIDGIDISKIGLTDLRSKVTIIPQDPTILSGTLRSTLDIFGEYDDSDIYEALRRVHLIPTEGTESVALSVDADGDEINANVFRSLESVVNENGDNFSQGQKQLLCMARAILRRNKILIMDEATASIDYETDTLINKTIREEFSDSTIITIAHRLRTIIDFDKVIVMDAGHLKEYDSPYNLLQDPDSKFHALCLATGPNEFEILLKLAEEAEKARENRK